MRLPRTTMLAALALALLAAAPWRAAQAQSPTQPAPSPAPLPAAAPPQTKPDTTQFERLQVADPFLEFHTGPGRGYPVFYVAERHHWVTVELRRTDWYRVRAEGGQVGWVHRNQLATTLTEAGGTKSFRDILVDDYLRRKLEFGGGWGRFGGEPMLKFWGTYKPSEVLGVEATFGQVQGVFSGTDFWHVALFSEPWSDKRLSPYFSVGLGNFKNLPNASLVSALPTDARLGHAGLGLRWYLGERFVARLDWSTYAAFVSDQRTLEYKAVTIGLSFFF